MPKKLKVKDVINIGGVDKEVTNEIWSEHEAVVQKSQRGLVVTIPAPSGWLGRPVKIEPIINPKV